MSRENERIERFYLGEMPLIKKLVEQMGWKEIFSRHLKAHGNERVPPVDALMMLLYNITGGRQPLYELGEWVWRLDPKVYGYQSRLKRDSINDDRFGRALDKLYWADRATMMTEIVVGMVKMHQLNLEQMHNDSTTVKAYGKISGTTRTGLKLTRGYSKDHRPDLKQLLYALTVSSDGAVPVHYKTYAGNTTDDTTHIETWNTLTGIIGHPSFLYVADCKVCTDKQLSHIVSRGGRVITIIPETWQETKIFKDEIKNKKKIRKIIWRRKIPGKEELNHQFEYFSSYQGQYRTAKRGYPYCWIYSSEKKKRDRENRITALKHTEKDLAGICGRLNTGKLKTPEAILDQVNQILKARGTGRFFHVKIDPVQEKYSVQAGPGRPGSETRFKTIIKEIYALSSTRRQKELQEELKVDGIFPLLMTDPGLTAKEALVAYKYQPRLEKRFNLLKSILNVAPLLFKKIERVEAIMFLFFLALMIQALIERKVRMNMKAQKIKSLPLYPEHRLSFHPTTAKIFDRFEGVSYYHIKQGDKVVKTLRDELSDIHREILEVFDMSENEYWLKNHA